MKNLTKKLTGLLAGVLLVVAMSPAAYAQDEESERPEGLDAFVTERCELAQERVTTRLTNYPDKKAQFVANYDEAKETLAEVIEYLDAEGYDVDNLKNSQTVIEGKIDDFIEQYAILIDRLEEVDALYPQCGDGSGAYLDAYNEARKQGIEVREVVRDIRQYYRNEIRDEVRDLKRDEVLN